MRLQSWGLPAWTLAALLFAVTTGGPVPWFLFKFLLALHLLGAVWAALLARGLDAHARVDRASATAGERVQVEVFVHNGSILPAPRLRLALPAWEATAHPSYPTGRTGPGGPGARGPGERGPAAGHGQGLPGGQAPTGGSATEIVGMPAGGSHPSAAGAGQGPSGGRRGAATGKGWRLDLRRRGRQAPAGGLGGTVLYQSLGPLGNLVHRETVILPRRGRYTLGPVVVELQEPLGLFRVRRVIQAEPALTVYPRAVPVDDLPVLPRQPFGRQRVDTRAWQDPSSLADVRPFQPGDNPKHIHWKVSARLNELHVKEFDLRATTDCFLFLDLYSAAGATEPVHEGAAPGGALVAEPATGSAGQAPGPASPAAAPPPSPAARPRRPAAPAPSGASPGRDAAGTTPPPAAASPGDPLPQGLTAGLPAVHGERPGAAAPAAPGVAAAARPPGSRNGPDDGVLALGLDEGVAGVAAGIGALALQRELVVAAAAHTDRPHRLPPGRGPQHGRRLLEWLVDVNQPGTMPLADFLTAQRSWLTPRSAVLVVTPQLDRRLGRVLVQLRSQGHAVGVWLVHPDLPPGTAVATSPAPAAGSAGSPGFNGGAGPFAGGQPGPVLPGIDPALWRWLLTEGITVHPVAWPPAAAAGFPAAGVGGARSGLETTGPGRPAVSVPRPALPRTPGLRGAVAGAAGSPRGPRRWWR